VVANKHHTKALTTGNNEDFLCLVLCKVNSKDIALHVWNYTSLVTAVIRKVSVLNGATPLTFRAGQQSCVVKQLTAQANCRKWPVSQSMPLWD